MDLSDPFQPRPSQLCLLFTCDQKGTIDDLRRGIRLFLSRYYPSEVALRMACAPTYNYVFSRDRLSRCIMVTAEGWTQIDSVLIDLYGRLLTQKSEIRTRSATYSVALDGTDQQRVHIVSAHYFWLNDFFVRREGSKNERHLLN